MKISRKIHPDFQLPLILKDTDLVELFCDLREFILEIYPQSNELLYHTHALTALFSTSEKMSNGFCMIPIYANHLNLGFNQGTMLDDPDELLVGTGKLIRHIPITNSGDYRNDKVTKLVKSAVQLALQDMKKPTKTMGKTISKIKKR